MLQRDFMNGSEFFLNIGFTDVGGFWPYFNDPDPVLPPSFPSARDLSAKTQFTILEDFPPYK